MTNSIVNIHLSEKRIDSDHVWVEDLSYYFSTDEWDGEKVVTTHHGNLTRAELTQKYAELGIQNQMNPKFSPCLTPEVASAYNAFISEQRLRARSDEAEKRAAQEAARITRGKTVKVVAGRKVAKGTVGLVLWMEEGGFEKVLLGIGERGADGKFSETAYSYLKNLEVVR